MENEMFHFNVWQNSLQIKKKIKKKKKQQQQQQKGNEMDLWREDKTRPS